MPGAGTTGHAIAQAKGVQIGLSAKSAAPDGAVAFAGGRIIAMADAAGAGSQGTAHAAIAGGDDTRY